MAAPRLIAPWPLLLGAAASFAACCLLGRALSRVNVYRDFARFHPHLSCLSLYYPTASQARSIARARLTPERVAVVVGGSSVLYGYGQGAEHLWTKHLEAQLGDGYRVFNFALQGAPPADIGPVAAEAIQREHAKVIFVTNVWAGTGNEVGDADGALHRYFFWDAYYKGLLTRDPEREARLAELEREKKDDPTYAELKRRARLDAWLYNQDLWTAFSYRCASTVWCPLVRGSVLRPRMRYPDADYIAPDRRAPRDEEVTLRALRVGLGLRWPLPPAPDPRADYSVTPLVWTFQRCVAAPFRRRTLVVLNHLNPYYVQRLPPDVQARHASNYRESVWALGQAGFAALELGRDFTDPDFLDVSHVSAEAAPKMATEVAAKVRQMARELGYTQ